MSYFDFYINLIDKSNLKSAIFQDLENLESNIFFLKTIPDVLIKDWLFKINKLRKLIINDKTKEAISLVKEIKNSFSDENWIVPQISYQEMANKKINLCNKIIDKLNIL